MVTLLTSRSINCEPSARTMNPFPVFAHAPSGPRSSGLMEIHLPRGIPCARRSADGTLYRFVFGL